MNDYIKKDYKEFNEIINNILFNKVNKLCNDLTNKYNETWGHDKVAFTFKEGRKYIKIIETNKEGKHRSAWGFIKYNGDVLKASTWSRPAKHSRGNIIDGYEITSSRIYSPDYLR